MTQSNPPEKPDLPKAAPVYKFAMVGGEVGCITLLIVIAAIFGGLWLDRFFDTKPLFTMMFVLGSAPLALVLTFWLAKRAVDPSPKPPAGGTKPTWKEEDSGE
jgi:hypothetical protein